MQVPAKLVAMAKRYEGFSAIPYLCPAGYWTIGYGRRCEKDTPPTTEEAATVQLVATLQTCIAEATALSPILLTHSEDRLTAIADFIYNLGATRYKSSTLRKRVNDGLWNAAEKEIQRWVWGGGVKLPGLVTRRAEEARLLRV